jgi:signal transduction histidine kinase
MNLYIRSLLSPVTLVLVMLYGFSLKQTPLMWSLLAIILLTYLMMTWVRQSWWTCTKYALSACLVMALICILRLCYGITIYGGTLLIPLILLLAREQQQGYRRVTALLAAMTMAVMFAISFPSLFAFQLLWEAIVLFVCIRAINIFKEAYRLSQLHLQELNEAHRELQQMHEALQEASVHSMRYAALTERTRLARDMHDGLGHQLTSLIVQLQALEIMLPGDPVQAANAVPGMLEAARQAMAEVRLVVGAWREDESGLGLAALKGLVSQSAAHAHLALEFQQDDDLSDWSVEASVALYRILQEALTNIIRHAEATTAGIQVQERNQQVILTVSDNGRYTENTELAPGFGIKGIMERSQALGGSCTFAQNRPHGLRVQVRLPNAHLVQSDGVLKQASPGNGRAAATIALSDWSARHG